MLAEEWTLWWRQSCVGPKLLSGFIGLALSEIIIAKLSVHSSKRSTGSDDSELFCSHKSVDQALILENTTGCIRTARLVRHTLASAILKNC